MWPATKPVAPVTTTQAVDAEGRKARNRRRIARIRVRVVCLVLHPIKPLLDRIGELKLAISLKVVVD
jgi:hypothetical protein